MSELDEIQVATNFKNGDVKAFEILFNMFYPKIKGFAQGLLGRDNPVAEDISMESFSKLHKLRQNFETIPNIRAFLYITTRNACLDQLRYSNRQEILVKEWINTVEHQSFIEIKQVEGEMFNAVKDAIERLPQKCRQVIQMIYFEGLGTAEISSRLSISIATVRSQKRHGIGLLKAAFADKEMVMYALILFACNLDMIEFAVPGYQKVILIFIQLLIIRKILTSFFAR